MLWNKFFSKNKLIRNTFVYEGPNHLLYWRQISVRTKMEFMSGKEECHQISKLLDSEHTRHAQLVWYQSLKYFFNIDTIMWWFIIQLDLKDKIIAIIDILASWYRSARYTNSIRFHVFHSDYKLLLGLIFLGNFAAPV